MITTDDEHQISPKTNAAWRRYEIDVYEALNRLDGSTLTHDVKRTGRLSGTQRQIDVLIEGKVAGSPVEIVVECKNYAKPIGIGMIDEFAGKLADLQAQRGIIYALSGLTSGARFRAEGAYPSIEVRDLSAAAPSPRNWAEYINETFKPKFGDCENPNCINGDVDWQEWTQDDGSIVEAGACRACGTWAVRCECAEAFSFFTDDETCVGCGRRYSQAFTSDASDIDSIVRLSGPTE